MTSRSPFQIADRLALFPESTRVRDDALTIAGHNLASLADLYGTPLYIYDRATLDLSVAAYKGALKAYYPGKAEITYAGKAFLCKAIAQWTQEHNLFVDCTGEGEIGIAVAGGLSREHILVHGVNRSLTDLQSAIKHAGTIVVDNLSELHHIHVILSEAKNLADLARDSSVTGSRYAPTNTGLLDQRLPQSDMALWLRLLPGVAVSTHHAHTQTGQIDSKFGMTRDEIIEAVKLCRQYNLPWNGLHFHQGSNFRDPQPLSEAISIALDLVKDIGPEDNWHFCPGGGWGAAYHEDELPNPDIEEYVRVISHAVVEGCEARGLSLPNLHLEPGRSLVARAGVAIYRVGAIKRRGERIWILVDGGMTDNPRHAMYGAKYSCLAVAGLGRELSERVHIAGPYCESGDVLIEDLPMPKIEEGELIAVPVSGAYHLSMSSNYNGARRPAVLWLEDGSARVIIQRETTDDLLRRDLGL